MVRTLLGRLRQRIVYGLVYRMRAVRERGAFTAGYWPPLPTLIELPALRPARTQANLYEYALRVAPGGRAAPRAVLDIGCGLGGGLLYAHAAFPEARLVGVDTSTRALKLAWRRLSALPRVELRRAHGDRTLLPPHGFDLILSVGSVNAIGPTELLGECARLLAPGGVVSLVALFQLPPEAVVTLFHAAAWQAGLTLRSVTEITAATRAAQEHDRPWLERMVRAWPIPLRGLAREAAALPGTRAAQAISEGRLRSYAILVDSPAPRWEAPRLLAA